MTRFNAKIGAAILVGLGLIYMVSAVTMGHSAASVTPPDLSAPGAGLDVWRALALMARNPGQVAILDVRTAEQYRLFHLPGASSLPGAGVGALVEQVSKKTHLLLVAQKETEAARLVGELRARVGPSRGAGMHFIEGGANAWYLALVVPVPLFSSAPPPFGYDQALDRVKRWLRRPGAGDFKDVLRSIGVLSSVNYQPTLLQGKPKAKASGKKKKIAGGCG